MDTSKMITGQVIMRQKGTDGQGRKLMIVCGVIAVPPNMDLADETQYTVTSDNLVGMVTDKPHILWHPDTATQIAETRHPDEITGDEELPYQLDRMTPNEWLTTKKWRT